MYTNIVYGDYCNNCNYGDRVMPEFSEAVLAGRRYLVLEVSVRPKRVKTKGREYLQHYINLPKWLATRLYEMAGEKPEVELPVVMLIAPAEWYHGILWEEMPERAWKTIPEKVRRELEALGLSRTPRKPVFIVATEEEIRELGLDPNKPITLEELKRKIIEQEAKKAAPIILR